MAFWNRRRSIDALGDHDDEGLDGPQREAGGVGNERLPELVETLPAQPDHGQVMGDDGPTGQSARPSIAPGTHSLFSTTGDVP